MCISLLDRIIRMKRNFESEIQTLTYMIQEKRENIVFFDEYINKHCKHEWVEDYIDLLEKTQKIIYCKHCELSK